MSLLMSVVKARKAQTVGRYGGGMMYNRGYGLNSGDNIFSGLLRGVGKVLGSVPIFGGLIGAGTEALAGLGHRNPKSKGASVAQIAPSMPTLNFGGGSGPGMGGNLPLSIAGGTPQVGSNTPGTGIMGWGSDAHRPGSTDMAPTGYHWNKSGYWTDDNHALPGAHWVKPGTRLVRNRQRNPFNPKAASRSMSRLASLSHGMKVLERHMAKLAPRRPARAAVRAFGKKK